MTTRDKWNSARVGKENDGRVKLTIEDKEDIQSLYHVKKLPIREIARIYEKVCSRRMIQFVLFPERLEIVKKRAIEVKRWEPYNTKDIRREVMRKYRAKLRKLKKV